MTQMTLMSTREAATALGLSRQQVARLVAVGELVAVAQGPGSRGAYLFDPEHVAEVAAQRAGERSEQSA